jgi:protein involved in polysaccharide export with SLBB domain
MDGKIIFKTISLCFIFIGFLFFPGCAHKRGMALQSSDIVTMNTQSESNFYVLGVGDSIAIKFFYNDRLNDDVTVGPDGTISLQLIGSVTAVGLTPSQLEDLLRKEYSKVLQSGENYVLSVGDKIAVKFFYNDKLNDEVVVRPDGKISLQLVDDISAAGLTPSQLDAVLTQAYSKLIKSPDVTVIVKEFKTPELTVEVKEAASQKIYVGGEVNRPGLISIRGRLKILDAIIQAGGAIDTAEINNVILIRYKGVKEPDVYSLDLKRIIYGEIPDIILKPYDIVYLPQSPIAEVNKFVRQYITNMLPSQVLFSFPYNLNPEVQVERK